jgi:hypothetical protein
MFHPQPVQQRDQARTALVGDAVFLLDPGASRAGGSRQRLGDPCFQPILLLIVQAARTAIAAKARQPFEAVFLIQPISGADGVVVQQQHLGDIAAAHALVQQHQCVGTPSQPMRSRAVACQFD